MTDMFFNLFRYRIAVLVRQKTVMFWSLVFPILLGTLFFLGFGNSNEIAESFSSIDAAVCADNSMESAVFSEIIKQVEYGEGKKMFNICETDYDTAVKKLQADEIKVIICAGSEFKVISSENGMSQSIAKQFVDQYVRVMAMYNDVYELNPDNMNEILGRIQEEVDCIDSVSLGGEKVDSILQYFYALIAMTCMYGSFVGLSNAEDIQANTSPLGARRVIAPVHHMKLIIADMLAGFTLHFVEIVIAWLYLRFVLGLEIGTQPALFLLVCFFGSLIGVGMGTFIGAVSKGNMNKRIAISLSISMITSALAGLMVHQLKYIVQVHAPILNMINPAALITDSFFCLTVYSDYKQFTINIAILAAMSAILIIGSFFAVRRTKYVSV